MNIDITNGSAADETVESAMPILLGLSLPRWDMEILCIGTDADMLSTIIADIQERYAVPTNDSLPDYIINEWLFVSHTYYGPELPTHYVMFIESEIMEAWVGGGVKLGVDSIELPYCISMFSVAERVAIADFLDRFWRGPDFHEDVCGHA